MSDYAAEFAAAKHSPKAKPASAATREPTAADRASIRRRTAITSTSDPKLVVLHDGRIEHAITAEAGGFFIVSPDALTMALAEAEDRAADPRAKATARAAARVEANELKRDIYAHEIRSLPEARYRRAAAGRVIAAHNARSMSPERAAIFLRNLPLEEADAPTVPTSIPRHAEQPSTPLRRRAELALAAASAKARAGDFIAERRVKAIGDALKLHADRGVDLARALEVSGVVPQSL